MVALTIRSMGSCYARICLLGVNVMRSYGKLAELCEKPEQDMVTLSFVPASNLCFGMMLRAEQIIL